MHPHPHPHKNPLSNQQYGTITKTNIQSNLRSSSKFLNMQILRLTLSNSPNKNNISSPTNVYSHNTNTNSHPYANQSFYVKRASNMHMCKQKPLIQGQQGQAQQAQIQEMDKKQHTYTRLKDTLKGLQNKINQAQSVLAKSKVNTSIDRSGSRDRDRVTGKNQKIYRQRVRERDINQYGDISGQISDVDQRMTKKHYHYGGLIQVQPEIQEQKQYQRQPRQRQIQIGRQRQRPTYTNTNINQQSIKTCKISKSKSPSASPSSSPIKPFLRQTLHHHLNTNNSMSNNKILCSIKPNKQYYISSLLKLITPSSPSNKIDPRIKRHINLSFDIFKKYTMKQAPSLKQLSQFKVNFAILASKKYCKTLLLDIDDTLLYCDQQINPNIKYDFQISIPNARYLNVNINQVQVGNYNNYNQTQRSRQKQRQTQRSKQSNTNINNNNYNINMTSVTVYIKLRPYILTFLHNLSKLYQIIAYTGSTQKYINKVLNQIDPQGQIFSYRLYRENCFQISSEAYVKDIRIINRRPQNVVLVDNSPFSYVYQLENGVPVLPYQVDVQGGGMCNDEELLKLEKYLIMLSKCEDVREVNKEVFGFHRYREFDTVREMIQGLYGNGSAYRNG